MTEAHPRWPTGVEGFVEGAEVAALPPPVRHPNAEPDDVEEEPVGPRRERRSASLPKLGVGAVMEMWLERTGDGIRVSSRRRS